MQIWIIESKDMYLDINSNSYLQILISEHEVIDLDAKTY